MADQDVLMDGIRAVKEVLPLFQTTVVNVARIDERLATLKSSLDKMYSLIFEGNGHPSLSNQISEMRLQMASMEKAMTQMASMEKTMTSLNTELESVKQSFADQGRDEKEMAKLRVTTANAIKLCIISTCGSIVVALIGAAVLYLK